MTVDRLGGMAGRDVACSARTACWQSSSILFLSFTAMASGPDTQVKMLATGLAAGILLDATVIGALVVPAVVALMGRWNWWLARWPARLLRVQPSVLARVRTETPE